jgi:WD40 repeat protein
MVTTHWKVGAVLVVTLSLVGVGATMVAYRAPGGQPQEAGAERKKLTDKSDAERPVDQDKQVRLDRYGDPLPPGAITRFGTARFRHDGEACSLVFSPDGKILGARSCEGIILWDTRTGKHLRRLRVRARDGVTIDRLIDFSPDSRILAAPRDAREIGFWDVTTGKLLRSAILPEVVDDPDGSDTHTVRFSPDGKFLAVGGSNNSYVLDTATGKPLHHFKELVGGLAFSPDGAYAVCYALNLPRSEVIYRPGAPEGWKADRKEPAPNRHVYAVARESRGTVVG